MFQLTNKVLGAGDPEYQTDVPEDERGTDEAAAPPAIMGIMQMLRLLRAAADERAEHRREDLVSLLVDSELEGDHLSDEDILWFCFLLILAGNETTRNGISGGLLALCEHPDERARLQPTCRSCRRRSKRSSAGSRPSPTWRASRSKTPRSAASASAAGERVVMWYPAVNRDEDVFPAPHRFDITRTPNDHLAFGIGEHFCLGAGFARLETAGHVRRAVPRFPDIQLNGPAERLRSTFIGGIKHLPVRFTPSR